LKEQLGTWMLGFVIIVEEEAIGNMNAGKVIGTMLLSSY
jgi:hypothetical protein